MNIQILSLVVILLASVAFADVDFQKFEDEFQGFVKAKKFKEAHDLIDKNRADIAAPTYEKELSEAERKDKIDNQFIYVGDIENQAMTLVRSGKIDEAKKLVQSQGQDKTWCEMSLDYNPFLKNPCGRPNPDYGNTLLDKIARFGDCSNLMDKCKAPDLTRDVVDDCHDGLIKACKGIHLKDQTSQPQDARYVEYSKEIGELIDSLGSQRDSAPYGTKAQGELAKAYVEKVNICKKATAWGYFTDKAPPKKLITCDRCTNSRDPKFHGGFISESDCDAARLADKSVQTINGVNRCTQTISTNQQATVMAVDYMFHESQMGTTTKASAFFSSQQICNDATTESFKTTPVADYQKLEIFPIGSKKDNRVIKSCYKKTVTVCGSGGDKSIDEIEFVK